MSGLFAIFAGVIQGLLEVFPVSSFGHIIVLASFMDIEIVGGVLFESMLHLGSMVAIILYFKKDFKKIGEEFIGLCLDIFNNIMKFIKNKRTGSHYAYNDLTSGTYRRSTILFLISMLPTMILGFTARRIVAYCSASTVMTGIGFLLTAVFLIVIDFSKVGGKKTPQLVSNADALWIGIMQGISVFPGVSRLGLTVGTGLLCGFNLKFAFKYSYMLSVPAIFGAVLSQLVHFGGADMDFGIILFILVGTIVAGITTYTVIRSFMRIVQNVKLRVFAFYCFIIGLFVLFRHYGAL